MSVLDLFFIDICFLVSCIICIICLIIGIVLASKYCSDWRMDIWKSPNAENMYYKTVGVCCLSLLVLVVSAIIICVVRT